MTPGQYTNLGTVTAVDPNGTEVTDSDASNHFGEQPPTGSIGDKVFEDLDADGIQDANEPGIPGATVKLQAPNGTTLDTTVTNDSGLYEFTDLAPGQYKVMFTQPTGFDGVSPFQAGNRQNDSDADPNNGLMSDVVTVAAGEANNSLDAGFFKFATLGNKVFNDLDRDGIQDGGEPGIAGATVKLQDSSGQTLSTTTTNGNGIYEFSDLIPGQYKVMFTQPTGFNGVSPFEVGNNPAIDSDADPNNGLMSDVVTLTSGETDNTLDGGFFQDVNAEIDIEKFVKVDGGSGAGDDDDDDDGGYHPSGSGDDDDDDDGGYHPSGSGDDDDDD
ncbi:SdrD B-like domain-containing protein, partial [Hydrocoleum sp. CS-953]|uniref:SdrD B-like domain-containing protein n=1 Tax=Hydrocoleum sp. CS-953 TaxID=1671698 RepID=UPI001FEFEFC3